MNEYTAKGYRAITITAIGSLIIGMLLALTIFTPIHRGAEHEYILLQNKLAVSVQKTADLNELLSIEKYTTSELRSLLKKMAEKYDLVTTLRQAGWKAETPEQARLLMSELSRLPLGSPFNGGHRITSQYGVYSIDEYGWLGVNHPGIDIVPLKASWNIFLPADATLIDFGISDSWGKYMTFQTDSGYQLFFAHLSKILWQDLDGSGEWSLTNGDKIPKGSRIAVMGDTGRYSTGAHLHYEIRTFSENNWTPLDPEVIAKYTGGTYDNP